jgi:hypothetical protein
MRTPRLACRQLAEGHGTWDKDHAQLWPGCDISWSSRNITHMAAVMRCKMQQNLTVTFRLARWGSASSPWCSDSKPAPRPERVLLSRLEFNVTHWETARWIWINPWPSSSSRPAVHLSLALYLLRQAQRGLINATDWRMKMVAAWTHLVDFIATCALALVQHVVCVETEDNPGSISSLAICLTWKPERHGLSSLCLKEPRGHDRWCGGGKGQRRARGCTCRPWTLPLISPSCLLSIWSAVHIHEHTCIKPSAPHVQPAPAPSPHHGASFSSRIVDHQLMRHVSTYSPWVKRIKSHNITCPCIHIYPPEEMDLTRSISSSLASSCMQSADSLHTCLSCIPFASVGSQINIFLLHLHEYICSLSQERPPLIGSAAYWRILTRMMRFWRGNSSWYLYLPNPIYITRSRDQSCIISYYIKQSI